jgi:DNA repair protein RecN (Recombination protein N)
MLIELYVRNLAVIEELRLGLRPGLTILSGEEGAGKSLLVDALCLLLGGRASASLVRRGASAALIEGIFWVPEDDNGLVRLLRGAGLELEGDGTLILAREVQEQGRSIARVNGRAVPLSLLRELGQRLADIHSQMEHLSLLNTQRQLYLLDAYGGLLEPRGHLGSKVAALREKIRELSTLTGKEAQHQREMLEYQIAEIEEAKIHPGEDEVLQQEWEVLQRAQVLTEGCNAAYETLYASDQSAAGLVHLASKALRGIVPLDPNLHPYLETLESAAAELEETARELRSYAEGLESRSGQLEQVEERLRLLRRLKGKYGQSLAEVMSFAARAREELEALQTQEERRCRLEGERRRLEEETGRLAEKLSAARQEAAEALTQLVNKELTDLGMPWARFGINLRQEAHPDGLPTSQGTYSCNQYGIDRVEFLGATNPGEPLKPLAEIASGGETCRFMLALKSALRQADPVPTLVFDEIDIGMGGRNAHIVGRKLANLARDRQVICITHLPQIACFGQDHYRLVKEVRSGRAVTRIEHLEGGSRLKELAAMLGSKADGSMLESARELLKRAEEREPEEATIT